MKKRFRNIILCFFTISSFLCGCQTQEADITSNEQSASDNNETESDAETETTTETVEETANEVETDAETEMIVDLDDEEVPLANTRPETPGNSKMPIVVSGLVAGCGLIALIIAIVFFMKRR